MKTQNQLSRTIIIFVALAIASAILMLAARPLADAFSQEIVLSFATAIFASGLTFFLVRMTNP